MAADFCEKYSKSTLTVFYLHHYSTTIERERLLAFNWLNHYLMQKVPERFTWIRVQKNIDLIQKRWKEYSWEKTASLVRRRQLRLLCQKRQIAGKSIRVLLGHHLSDYEETLELRRERKIPERDLPLLSDSESFTLYERPLFEHDRASIRNILNTLKIPYFDDPDNYNFSRARNRLRSESLTRPLDKPSRIYPNSSIHPITPKLTARNKIIVQKNTWDVVSFYELRMPYSQWITYSQSKQRRLVFHAYKTLQVANALNRSIYSRLHRLPVNFQPFICEREIDLQNDFVVARRGLNWPLPKLLHPNQIRGDQAQAGHFIRHSYGRKRVKKIFSERKYSLRQRKSIILTLHPENSDEVISIDTQYLQNTLDRPSLSRVQ